MYATMNCCPTHCSVFVGYGVIVSLILMLNQVPDHGPDVTTIERRMETMEKTVSTLLNLIDQLQQENERQGDTTIRIMQSY